VTTAIDDDQLPLAVPAEGLQPGRRLIVKGERQKPQPNTKDNELVHEATLVNAKPHPPVGAVLTIAPPLPAALRRDSVVVHGNVVPASHGETVSQILGSGNGGAPFQRFELKQLPLTWRAAATESGARSELTVRVADIAWAERETLFGATPTDRAYTLDVDEQGRNFVAFGDGVRGARLPSGVNNVRASYRKGLGLGGNVAADKLTQLVTRPLGLKSVSNPLAAEGGTDPEPESAARQSIPLTTRTLGRAVSLIDYEDFARGFSGIAKAQAQVLQLPAGPTIAITVAGPDGALLTEASPVWTNLLAGLRRNGDPHVAVMLLPADLRTFFLGLNVKRDPAFEAKRVLSAVEAALRDHFAFAARQLGQPVQQSEVIAIAHQVPGVVAVDLTQLHRGTPPFVQVRLLAARMHVSKNGVPMPAELLTLHPGPLQHLGEMA
jgi:predicted phage baseplate assembly protein